MENRTSAKASVQLSSLTGPAVSETVVTEDWSPHGVRVLTWKPWKPGERVLVQSIQGNLQARARVVYCRPAERNQFTVGLELFNPVGEWGTGQAAGPSGGKDSPSPQPE